MRTHVQTECFCIQMFLRTHFTTCKILTPQHNKHRVLESEYLILFNLRQTFGANCWVKKPTDSQALNFGVMFEIKDCLHTSQLAANRTTAMRMKFEEWR